MHIHTYTVWGRHLYAAEFVVNMKGLAREKEKGTAERGRNAH